MPSVAAVFSLCRRRQAFVDDRRAVRHDVGAVDDVAQLAHVAGPRMGGEASQRPHAAVSVVEKRMQGRDHPVLMGAPETYYLKCAILRRLE